MGNRVPGNATADNQLGKDTQIPTEKSINSQPDISQDRSLFQHNPTQLAKDEKGHLHPKWPQIVRKCQQKHKQKTQQLVKRIAQQTQKIGQECNNRYGQDQTTLMQCYKIVAQPIWKIEKKGQHAIMKLGQTANKCLLSNKKQDQCVQQVRKHLHNCLQDTLRDMKKITLEFQ